MHTATWHMLRSYKLAVCVCVEFPIILFTCMPTTMSSWLVGWLRFNGLWTQIRIYRSQDTLTYKSHCMITMTISYLKKTTNIISINCQDALCQPHLSTSLCYLLYTGNTRWHVHRYSQTLTRMWHQRVIKLSKVIRSVFCGQLIWPWRRSYNKQSTNSNYFRTFHRSTQALCPPVPLKSDILAL